MKPIAKLLIILLLVFLPGHCQNLQCSAEDFRVYPLVEGLMETIYLLHNNENTLFLVASCRRQQLLSLSINESLAFRQAPGYDIYGQHHSQKRDKVPFQQCGVTLTKTRDSLIQIRRKNSSAVIFTIKELSLSEGHHRIVIEDDSIKWGLGQRFQEHFQVTDGHWTIWNRDRPWQMDLGKHFQSCQTYGHQPIYLAREHYLSSYHLVYFKNTYGLMVESYQQSSTLVYNSVGGNTHFIILVGGEDPEELLKSYHEYIGKAHIPPFWSMGYHQSRWGYRSLETVEKVVSLFQEYEIPLDTFWLDLDYMLNKKIFTVDEISYPPEDLNELMKVHNLRLVPLLDVGIATKDSQPVKLGKNMNIFLRSPSPLEYYYKGEVWPGEVYYVDFLHPNASAFWKTQLEKLQKKINFSGIWLDMNEPTNFKGGEITFEPFPVQKMENINTMTVSVDVPHHSSEGTPLSHASVHAYYGHLSAIPTFEFLQQKGRPFILTRSNSVGTGVFAAHWTGDNVANWEFLKSSINSNFLYQIFGIQMVGSDICGFYTNSNADLCSRWMQLGSFYPFARNHNHETAIPQEPYAFGANHLLTSVLSLRTRYALLKQMYSWLVISKGKGSFFRPLGFEFYEDQTSFGEFVTETQFLLGKSLMVAPVLQPQADARTVYFPGSNSDRWYEFQINIYAGSVDVSKIKVRPHQWNYNVENPLPNPPLTFLRNGFLLLTNYPATRSNKLSNDFFLFCALKEGVCRGELLGLSDYQDEPKLSLCIRDDCIVNFSIHEVVEDRYVLVWSYKGPDADYEFKVVEVTIASEKEVCIMGDTIEIEGREGTFQLGSPSSCSIF